MAVLGAVSFAGDVNPVDATVGSLFDELIKVAVVHDPDKPFVEDFHVGVVLSSAVHKVIDGDVDVGGFSGHVLRVCCATYEFFEFGCAVATTDVDRYVEPVAEWFEDFLAEGRKIRDEG